MVPESFFGTIRTVLFRPTTPSCQLARARLVSSSRSWWRMRKAGHYIGCCRPASSGGNFPYLQPPLFRGEGENLNCRHADRSVCLSQLSSSVGGSREIADKSYQYWGRPNYHTWVDRGGAITHWFHPFAAFGRLAGFAQIQCIKSHVRLEERQ